jgi:Leucine-rich repeat (LRR) protein
MFGCVARQVGRLSRLRELHLNGNQLVALPDTIAGLVALEKLSVANNRLATLPPQIAGLSRLEELNLNGNPLVQGLPPEVGACSALEVMDLSACQLTALPDDFTLLTRLMELNLASNRLSQLPQTVGRMTRLVRLDLSDNRLSDLPLSTGHLTGLQTLMIQGNPIRNPRLLEKFSIGSDHLVDFLERRMMGTSTHLSITRHMPLSNGGPHLTRSFFSDLFALAATSLSARITPPRVLGRQSQRGSAGSRGSTDQNHSAGTCCVLFVSV